jgi:hypothetical protein
VLVEGESVPALYNGLENAVEEPKIVCEGNTFAMNLTQRFSPSFSGKTTLIASTEGDFSLPGRERVVGVNITRRRDSGLC